MSATLQTELVKPIYAPVIRQALRLLNSQAGLPVLHDVRLTMLTQFYWLQFRLARNGLPALVGTVHAASGLPCVG